MENSNNGSSFNEKKRLKANSNKNFDHMSTFEEVWTEWDNIQNKFLNNSIDINSWLDANKFSHKRLKPNFKTQLSTLD